MSHDPFAASAACFQTLFIIAHLCDSRKRMRALPFLIAIFFIFCDAFLGMPS
jgi:hypothetical protein